MRPRCCDTSASSQGRPRRQPRGPTVAFGGLASGRQTADLVEGLGRGCGDDWWYAGQLAFVRQDQERWDEAESLASYALSVEPSSRARRARPGRTCSTRPASTRQDWRD